MSIEKTLVLIKPDAIKRRLTGLVMDRVLATGLEMVGAKVVRVTEELAREHYHDLAEKPFFEELIKMIRGEFHAIPNNKVFVFVIKGENAVAEIRRIVGATNPEEAGAGTIRGSFGRLRENRMENVIHASSDSTGAKREISLWFKPDEIVE